MLLINTMRMVSLKRKHGLLNGEKKNKYASVNVGEMKLSLEEYDLKHSSKSLVLVGIQQ